MTDSDGLAPGLVSALARAQMKFPPIVKSHSNPAFKGSQYADVADVLAAVRPVLAAEGIVVTQTTDVDLDTGGVYLRTRLAFGDEEMESVFPLHIAGLTDQQVGSKLTYHRRYQLCAILGVHPVGDDDDGNLAATAAPVAEPVETADVARTREAVQEAIAGLSADDKELVKLEIRNQQVPSLRKPGATRTQLDGLVEFIAGLKERSEPFDVRAPSEADQGERDNGAGESTRAPDDERPLFQPVVALPANSGTSRKADNAIRQAT